MKAYILIEPKTFSDLLLQMKGCKVVDCEGFGKLRLPSGRVQKVLEYLRQNTGRSWTGEEVKNTTSTNVNRIKDDLADRTEELKSIGYKFERGGRGRSNAAKFTWIGISEDGDYTKINKAA